jgi:hypothetical protein
MVIVPLKPAGHANVRDPVASWQIINVAPCPAPAAETVELVTFPVNVISKVVAPDPYANAGVAENVTALNVNGAIPAAAAVCHTGTALALPVPVCVRTFSVDVVFPGNLVSAGVALAYSMSPSVVSGVCAIATLFPVVIRVPLVGNVTAVVAVIVNVDANAPAVV